MTPIRFAKIISIDGHEGTAHIQWFEHSSRTIMQEISDPMELFLCTNCDEIELKIICGKVPYKQLEPGQSAPPDNTVYYCR